MRDNKIKITTKPKYFHFDLPKYATNNLKHEFHSTIKLNQLFVEHTKKTKLENYCPNISMETIFMARKAAKQMNDTNFSQRLDLRSSNKNIALQNLSICYT